MKLKYQLPDFYSGLIRPPLLNLDLKEDIATCNNCYRADVPDQDGKFYDPHLKCCTFYPFLPNYLVGGIFADASGKYDAAKKILRDFISRRQYSLPIGMVAPVQYQLEFQQQKKSSFGVDSKFLCPYYDKAAELCSIWKYRGTVCTTFYCESVYGKKGLRFWERLGDYLSYVEMALLEEALANLDFSPRQVVDLLDFLNRQSGSEAETQSWLLSESLSKKLWNGYYEDQEGFFVRCFEIASSLNRESFVDLLGETGEALETEVETLKARL